MMFKVLIAFVMRFYKFLIFNIFNYYFLERQQAMLKQNINDAVSHLATSAQNYINGHKTVIANAANQLTIVADDPLEWQPMLSNLHESYPGFISMLIANPQAQIIAASPVSRLLSNNQTRNININDRDYFIESFYNHRLFVSSVFQGRGFGNDAIIAMSAPFYTDEHHTTTAGIVKEVVDFIVKKTLSDRLQIGLTAKNLLNPNISLTQLVKNPNTGIETNETVLTYKTGRQLRININYTF